MRRFFTWGKAPRYKIKSGSGRVGDAPPRYCLGPSSERRPGWQRERPVLGCACGRPALCGLCLGPRGSRRMVPPADRGVSRRALGNPSTHRTEFWGRNTRGSGQGLCVTPVGSLGRIPAGSTPAHTPGCGQCLLGAFLEGENRKLLRSQTCSWPVRSSGPQASPHCQNYSGF